MSEPTQESLTNEFPGWEIWLAISGLWCARVRGATPPVLVQGEDLLDLRDQIRRRISELETKSYLENDRHASS